MAVIVQHVGRVGVRVVNPGRHIGGRKFKIIPAVGQLRRNGGALQLGDLERPSVCLSGRTAVELLDESGIVDVVEGAVGAAVVRMGAACSSAHC